jgi:hypothetical protein
VNGGKQLTIFTTIYNLVRVRGLNWPVGNDRCNKQIFISVCAHVKGLSH